MIATTAEAVLGGRLCGVDRDGVVDVAVAIGRAGRINAVVVDVGLLHRVAGRTVHHGCADRQGCRGACLVAGQGIGNGDAGERHVAGVGDRDGVVDDVAGSIDGCDIRGLRHREVGRLRDGNGGEAVLGAVCAVSTVTVLSMSPSSSPLPRVSIPLASMSDCLTL